MGFHCLTLLLKPGDSCVAHMMSYSFCTRLSKMQLCSAVTPFCTSVHTCKYTYTHIYKQELVEGLKESPSSQG